VRVPADLILPAPDADTLREIASWDGVRLASYAASDFPVDVIRFEGSSSLRSSCPGPAATRP
jgi:hypothetical protein